MTPPRTWILALVLGGPALAVQLAAARIGILTPAELTRRLRLAALGDGASDAEERHRTVRATIDWSYELLDAAEREAFADMAVFAGGATLSAASGIMVPARNAEAVAALAE